MPQNFFSVNTQNRLDQLEQQAGNNPVFRQLYPNVFGQQNQNQNNVIYSLVSGGLDAVKAFPLRPGFVALLFDDRENVFFIKTVDAMGIQSIKKHTYQQVALPEDSVPGIAGGMSQNADVVELKKQVGELQMLMANFMQQNKPAEVKSEKADKDKSEAKK